MISLENQKITPLKISGLSGMYGLLARNGAKRIAIFRRVNPTALLP
jgi:hypothetical protein